MMRYDFFLNFAAAHAFELERETFGEAPRAYPGRVEPLHHAEQPLRLPRFYAEARGELPGALREVSALVEAFGYVSENLHLSVAEAASRELLHERVLERLLLRRGDVFEPAVLVVVRLLAHVRGVLLVEAREPFELFEAFGLGRLRRGLAALVELEQRIFGVKLFKTLRKLDARHLQHLERLYHFVGKRLRLFLFQLKHGGPPLRGDLPKSCAGLAVSAFHQTKAKAGKSQAGRPAYVFRRRSARLGNFCARRRV